MPVRREFSVYSRPCRPFPSAFTNPTMFPARVPLGYTRSATFSTITPSTRSAWTERATSGSTPLATYRNVELPARSPPSSAELAPSSGARRAATPAAPSGAPVPPVLRYFAMVRWFTDTS